MSMGHWQVYVKNKKKIKDDVLEVSYHLWCFEWILQALTDAGIVARVKRIAGSSAGAICAGLLAVGCTPQDIANVFKCNIKWLFQGNWVALWLKVHCSVSRSLWPYCLLKWYFSSLYLIWTHMILPLINILTVRCCLTLSVHLSVHPSVCCGIVIEWMHIDVKNLGPSDSSIILILSPTGLQNSNGNPVGVLNTQGRKIVKLEFFSETIQDRPW